MNLPPINSPTAALLAGLVTSLHCAGMCGPLACVLMPARGDRADANTVSTVYHLTRLTSYTLLGALVGGLGRLPLSLLSQPVLRWLPWLMVLFFVGLAFQWERFLPRLAGLGRWWPRLHAWLRGRSRVETAAALGFATPLVPCGPLYFVVAAALLAGSALHGAEFMLAFGVGTVPLLWLAQSRFHWVQAKLSPVWLGRVRMTLALAAALAIGWRLRATLGFAGPSVDNFICCF
jgi:uncharacterized protein